jgi:hypothetical protein
MVSSVDKAPAEPAAALGPTNLLWLFGLDSFLRAEGSILRGLEVTSLIIVAEPPIDHLRKCIRSK